MTTSPTDLAIEEIHRLHDTLFGPGGVTERLTRIEERVGGAFKVAALIAALVASVAAPLTSIVMQKLVGSGHTAAAATVPKEVVR